MQLTRIKKWCHLVRNQSTMRWESSKTLCGIFRKLEWSVIRLVQELGSELVAADGRTAKPCLPGSVMNRVCSVSLWIQLCCSDSESAALALWPRVSLLLSAALSAVIHTISAVSSHWSVLRYKLMEQTVIKHTVWRTSYYSTSGVTQFLLSQKNKHTKKSWLNLRFKIFKQNISQSSK